MYQNEILTGNVGVMADDGGKYSDFLLISLAKMASKRPSGKWGLSPVNERWFVIQIIAFLSDQLKQFRCYNVYKADSNLGLELFNFDCNKIEKMLPQHSFIL